MATKNFVPRGNLEGGIGTQSKKWGSGSFGQIQVSSKLSGSASSTGSFGQIVVGGGTFTSASLAAGGSGGVSSYTDLTNVPANIISGSEQLPSGIISGSSQLPSGIVSASVLSSPTQGTIRLANNGVNTDVDSGLQTADSPTFTGLSISTHITASGNISASGTVFASKFESAGQSNEVISFNDNLNITGNVTASGNISGSNSTTASFGSLKLTNLPTAQDPTVLVVDADGNISTDEIDARVFGYSGGQGTDLVTGAGANTRVPFYDATNNLGNTGDFTFNNSTGLLNIAHIGGRVNAKTGSFTRIQSTDVVATNLFGDGGGITGITSIQASAIRDLGAGIISGSEQLPSGIISGSEQLPSGIVSASSIAVGNQGEVVLTNNGVAGSTVDLGLQTTDSPTFAGLTSTGDVTIQGKLTAEVYAVSSSVTHMTRSFSSGSTIFGDTLNDTHEFTGSLLISGSLNASDATGSLGRIEAETISASRVDVDSGTLSIGGEEINSTLVQNISNAFSTTIIQNVTASFSGSAQSTASFGNLFIAGNSNQNYTDFSSSIASRVGSAEAGNITSVTAGDGLTGGGSSGGVSLAVQVDDSSLEINSDTVRVKASGVTNAMLQNDGITIAGNDTSLGGTITAATILDGTGVVSGSVVSSLPTGTVSGSAQITDVITQTYVSQSAAAAGFGSGGGGGGAGTGGIFASTGSIKSTTNDLQISGSVVISGSTLNVQTPFSGSTAIFANNIQAGYPTSNPWQEGLDGSFFNNFDNTTHVSEILRFMAGIISHSIDTSSPTANTKTYGSVSVSHTDGSETSKNALFNGVLGSTYENARLSQAWTGSAFIDDSEIPTFRAILNYLELKGFVTSGDRGEGDKDDVGTNPFHGSYGSNIPSSNITTQATFGTFSHTLSANAGGSSDVFSNSNHFGLGGLTSGGPTDFKVKVIATQSYSDSNSDTTPDQNSTFTRNASNIITQTSFGTTSGVTLAKIESANPAVIPAAFQDGDFGSVAGALSGRQYTGGATSATSISASGYYAYHDIKAGIATGSQEDFVFQNGSDSSTRFYIYTGDIPTDITTGAPTAVVSSSLKRTGFTATSRSLSGAPYILSCTYAFTFTSEVTKSFDPAHGYQSNILVNSNPTDQWENIGSTTLSNSTTTVNNAGVSSTGANNYVIDHSRTTKRTSGQTPFTSDVAVASSSLSFTLDSNSENIDQNRSSDESQNSSLSFRATGYNWKGSSVTSTSGTQQFYVADLFGQSSSSGSMAVYSRAQGYDANTLADTTETFVGEDFRIVVDNNVTTFAGNAFTTDSFQTNDEGDNTLGRNDLQVKPGYLVDPTGSYGYWFTNNSLQESNAGYRYYIRRFQKNSSGTKTSMTVNVGKTLVNWNSTSSGVAVALIFKSGTSAGSNTSITTCRLYDPSATVSNLIEAGVSQDYVKNPFSSNIDLYGNTGGDVSSTTYTVPMRNSDGMYLDDSDNELYVIIRYKGDQSPVTGITLSYS